MSFAACLFVCFITALPSAIEEYEVPGLGTVELPVGKWKLESKATPTKGTQIHVLKRDDATAERITIVRFEKNQGPRGLTVKDSYRYCDFIADSIYAGGVPLMTKETVDKTVVRPSKKTTNHMIRLPNEDSVEPLGVTNICAAEDGDENWMNHGLIASNKEYIFLFIHTSNRVLSPETIENVYLSSPLTSWPRKEKEKDRGQ